MAVLIIHALIKQLGMRGARSRRGEKTSESEKKTGRDSGEKISENKRPSDGGRVRREERRGGRVCSAGFSAGHDSWAVNMQSLMAIRQSEERRSSTCCTQGRNPSEGRGKK